MMSEGENLYGFDEKIKRAKKKMFLQKIITV